MASHDPADLDFGNRAAVTADEESPGALALRDCAERPSPRRRPTTAWAVKVIFKPANVLAWQPSSVPDTLSVAEAGLFRSLDMVQAHRWR